MKIPPNVTLYELRVKVGRRHHVVMTFTVPDGQSWWWHPQVPIVGKCRWYARRRGKRWTPHSDWFRYVPE